MDSPLTPEQLNVVGINALDGPCKEHDIAYSDALDITDAAPYWDAIVLADAKLIQTVRALDPAELTSEARDYRNKLIAAFWWKLLFHDLPRRALALRGPDSPPIPAFSVDYNTVINWQGAQRWIQPRRDPLTLDLDRIETVALSATNPILFDHDGDGLKGAVTLVFIAHQLPKGLHLDGVVKIAPRLTVVTQDVGREKENE